MGKMRNTSNAFQKFERAFSNLKKGGIPDRMCEGIQDLEQFGELAVPPSFFCFYTAEQSLDHVRLGQMGDAVGPYLPGGDLHKRVSPEMLAVAATDAAANQLAKVIERVGKNLAADGAKETLALALDLATQWDAAKGSLALGSADHLQ
eukprot:8594005-Pyramimonas_sp.AAC.1